MHKKYGPSQEKAFVEIWKNTENCNYDGAIFGRPRYEERLKEMQLTTLKERRKREDLITIYKFDE